MLTLSAKERLIKNLHKYFRQKKGYYVYYEKQPSRKKLLQQQFIILLLGLIGTGLIALTTFFGLNSKKEISKIINNEYKDQVNNEIEDIIGGHNKIQYLEKSIQKEEVARSKKILFLLQEESDKSLKRICSSLRTQGYSADERTISTILSNGDIRSILDGYNLVIYEVSSLEFENADC